MLRMITTLTSKSAICALGSSTPEAPSPDPENPRHLPVGLAQSCDCIVKLGVRLANCLQEPSDQCGI